MACGCLSLSDIVWSLSLQTAKRNGNNLKVFLNPTQVKEYSEQEL